MMTEMSGCEGEGEGGRMIIDMNTTTTTEDDPVKYNYQPYRNSERINSTRQTVQGT
jgi:hypothetical protein